MTANGASTPPEVLPGRFLGRASDRVVAHRMLATPPRAVYAYRSVCGLYWTSTLRPAAQDIPDCRQCARRLATMPFVHGSHPPKAARS